MMNKLFTVCCITIFFILPLLSVTYAQEKQVGGNAELFDYEAQMGYRHYNVKGHRGKVGEYEVLDSGLEAGFKLYGKSNRNYFNFEANLLDKRDQAYVLNYDISRIINTDLSYRRYRHYLDHDPLSNQDSFQDFDKGWDNGITLEEIKADNTIRIPALPFLKFKADYRKYSKRGHRQAMTVSKCSKCHVSSRNRRINSHTDDITFGVEAKLGQTTIQYQHLWRSFKEDASAPVNNYGKGATFFLIRDRASYNRVPDSKTRIHRINLNTELPLATYLFASYQWGERSNRDTRNDIDFNSFAARLSKYITRRVSADMFYSRYHMDNDSPEGLERDIERGGLRLNARILKRTTFKLTYQWKKTDRNNFNESSTYQKTYRLTVNHRIARHLSLHLKYQKVKIDDPFVTVDRNNLNIVQTSIPKSEDEVYVSVCWSPRPNFSLNSNIRYFKGQHHHYDLDEDRYEFTVSAWYVPFERLTLSGSFSLRDNEIDTPSSYKTYHVRGPESIFLYNEIPYDDRSQSYYISASYQIRPKVAISADINYIKSNADFDTKLDSRNIGELSDIEIDQIQTSFGINYLYSPNVSLYAKYIFREYDDRENSYLDGQFSLVSFGMNYTF